MARWPKLNTEPVEALQALVQTGADDAAIEAFLYQRGRQCGWIGAAIGVGGLSSLIWIPQLMSKAFSIRPNDAGAVLPAIVLAFLLVPFCARFWTWGKIFRRGHRLYTRRVELMAEAAELANSGVPFILYLRDFNAEEYASNRTGRYGADYRSPYSEAPAHAVKRFVSECTGQVRAIELTAFSENPSATHDLLSVPAFTDSDWMRLVGEYLSASICAVVHYNGKGGALEREIHTVLDTGGPAIFLIPERFYETARLVPSIRKHESAVIAIYENRALITPNVAAIKASIRGLGDSALKPGEISAAWLAATIGQIQQMTARRAID
jgi:hypothetical protein